MVITNLKRFNEICKNMKDVCKFNSRKEKYEKAYHNVFFMDYDKMIATNGKYIVIHDVSDCVINDEKFLFPVNEKPVRVIDKIGETFVIKNKKEGYFSKDKMDRITEFDWKKAIPKSGFDKESKSEYDFSEYNFNISCNDDSKVRFYSNGEVEFRFNDDLETIGWYGDVLVKNDNFFDDDKNLCNHNNVSFPMKQIYQIFKFGKRFIMYEIGKVYKIEMKNCEIYIMKCVDF